MKNVIVCVLASARLVRAAHACLGNLKKSSCSAAPYRTLPSSPSVTFPRSFEWCAYLVSSERVGALGQEELHRRHMAVLRSEMEGRHAILRGGKEGDAARAMQ